MSSSPPRIWFITGASTGFGFYLTCHALDKGDIVVATMRNPSPDAESKYPASPNLLILKLDVTDSSAISHAFNTAKEKYSRVDIVFNNAGFAILTEFEGTPEDKARAMFDTNFWGASNVTKEAIKAFRSNSPPGGRLLQISSSSALTCNPGVSFYGASKAALESITEAVARELDPSWNIKITLIEPGPFDTAAIASNMLTLPLAPGSPYASSQTIGANPTRLWVSSGELHKIAGDPKKAVGIFYELGIRTTVDGGGEVPELSRVPLHSVAVQCAQWRIESMKGGVEEFQNVWGKWLE